MSAPMELSATRQEEILHEAVTRRVPVVLTVKVDEGWRTCKSRFLALEDSGRRIVLEYPVEEHQPVPEITGGQDLGLAFRKGHKKCVGNVLVEGRTQHALSPTQSMPALIVSLPDHIYDLQRRLYYRAPLPEGVTIPLDFWRPGVSVPPPNSGERCRGTIFDLSAGGVSVLLPPGERPRFEVEDSVVCSFRLEDNAQPIRTYAQFRYAEERQNGQLRIGFQFVGLDATKEGRDTLRRIAEATSGFQRAQMRK